jgi:hypothetical protein
MKKLIAVALLLGTALPSFSQLTQSIRGSVIDADTKAPLIGATITVASDELTTGSVSDQNGEFSIKEIAVGRVNILIQFLGYENLVMSQIELKSAKELVLNVALQEKFSSVGTVVITGKQSKEKPLNEMAAVSARSFTVEETSRYAAAAFDPARMAQNFAGVSSGGDDLFNEIVVRGNSPKGVLWRLEGIEIANPNHFAAGGGSGGAISMLSSSTLGGSDFFTGAFPAEYGNALSGVFDLRLRKGNNEKRENSFMIGALGIEIATEGPFSKNYKGSYLINYRYSTLGLLNAVNLNPAGDVLPAYQDLSYNFYLPTKKLGNFSIFGVTGQNISEMYDDFDSGDTSLDTRDNYDGFTELGFVNTTGIKHIFTINSKGYLKTVASHSYTKISGFDESLELDTVKNTVFRFIEDDVTNKETQARISTMFNYKFNTRSTLRTGLVLSRLDYNFYSKFSDYLDDTTFIAFDDKNNTLQYQAYAQWKYRLTDKITLNTGVHFTRLAATESNSIEPRASLSYKASPKLNLSASVGKHSRPEHIALYLFKVKDQNGRDSRPNQNLELTKAWHYVLAAGYRINPNVRVQAEAYYQHIFDVPISTVPGSNVSVLNTSNYWDAIFNGDTSVFMNGGTGANIGLDLTLERFFNKNYYYLMTATVFNSSYKTKTGKSYSTKYNGNFQYNLLGGKEFILKKKDRKIGINGKANFYGGNRYTPILLTESIAEGGTVRDQLNPFAAQTPLYYRFDVGFSYKFNRAKSNHSIMIDVQNVTARDNIGGTFYNDRIEEIENWTMTGLFPFINYRIEF